MNGFAVVYQPHTGVIVDIHAVFGLSSMRLVRRRQPSHYSPPVATLQIGNWKACFSHAASPVCRPSSRRPGVTAIAGWLAERTRAVYRDDGYDSVRLGRTNKREPGKCGQSRKKRHYAVIVHLYILRTNVAKVLHQNRPDGQRQRSRLLLLRARLGGS